MHTANKSTEHNLTAFVLSSTNKTSKEQLTVKLIWQPPIT